MAGRLSQAEAIYRQILTQNPNNPTALYLLGTLTAQVGHMDDAINLISKAIAIAPNQPQYHGNLGAIYLKLQRYDQGHRLPEILQSLSILKPPPPTKTSASPTPPSPTISNAITEFKKASVCLPSWPEPPNSLGLIYQHQWKILDDALAAFNRAVALNPQLRPGSFKHRHARTPPRPFPNRLGKKYEWRLKVLEVIVRKNLTPPQWTDARHPRQNNPPPLRAEGFGDVFHRPLLPHSSPASRGA